MKYTEVNFTIAPLDPCRDLLVDALGNEGPYDSFVEIPDGLKAYVPSTQFDKEWLQQQVDNLQDLASIQYSHQEMPDKNWNEEWEKQHKPVLVVADNGKQVWVRAPFHDHRADVDYEIEIEPKMSFGTAHHPTTYMMLSYVAEIPLQGKRVLDMGCGTAVLAILAKMRGAAYVEAIDIDEWAYNNALENAQRNNTALTIRLIPGTSPKTQESFPKASIVIGNGVNDGDTISGIVRDSNGPLMGATVCEINKLGRIMSSTVTDFYGQFKLKVVSTQNELRFSYLHCKTVKLDINGIRYDVEMQPVEKTVPDKIQKRQVGY